MLNIFPCFHDTVHGTVIMLRLNTIHVPDHADVMNK